MRKPGRPKKYESARQIVVYISSELVNKIDEEASARGLSRSAFIEEVLRLYLEGSLDNVDRIRELETRVKELQEYNDALIKRIEELESQLAESETENKEEKKEEDRLHEWKELIEREKKKIYERLREELKAVKAKKDKELERKILKKYNEKWQKRLKELEEEFGKNEHSANEE